MSLAVPTRYLVSSSHFPLASFWSQQLSLPLAEVPPSSGLYLIYDAQGLSLAHADLPAV